MDPAIAEERGLEALGCLRRLPCFSANRQAWHAISQVHDAIWVCERHIEHIRSALSFRSAHTWLRAHSCKSLPDSNSPLACVRASTRNRARIASARVHACICASACMHLRACVHASARVHACICASACMHLRACVHASARVHACICASACMNLRAHPRAH